MEPLLGERFFVALSWFSAADLQKLVVFCDFQYVGQYPQQHHTLPESPPCKAKLRVTAQSRPDRGPTDGAIGARSGPDGALGARSGPDGAIGARRCNRGPIGARGCNRAPIVPWCSASHPYYSSTPVFLSMRIPTVSIAKLGDASLVQLTGPD